MSALAQALARELALVESFLAVIRSEHEALKAGTADELPALGAAKMAAVEELNQISQERNALLQADGCAPDRGGMGEWLARHPGQRLAGEHWQRLLAAAAEARQLNEINGQLIAARLQMTGEVLEALTQQTRFSNLYGADGQSAQNTGSRIIDAA